jgi:hypothetical protein
MTQWKWAAASVRGTAHVRSQTRKQDSYACFSAGEAGSAFIAIVCDGAGSAIKGGEGASLTCRAMTKGARAHFARSSILPSDDDVWSWVDDARDGIARAALGQTQPLSPRDFASTLVLVISDGLQTVVGHIGDGCAVALDSEENWLLLSEPAQGDYASTTYFVTDDPAPKLRLNRLSKPLIAIAAMTDGLERLALNLAAMTPHRPFFDAVIRPVRETKTHGKEGSLSTKLASYLDSAAVNQRTDDDKTLVLAAR